MRALLAKARTRAVDEFLVQFRQVLVAEAKAGQRTKPKVFHQHVGARGKPAGDLDTGFCLEVCGDAQFIAVNRHESGRLAIDERRRLPAAIAHSWGFDLDHLGAKVRQDHRAIGSRQEVSQLYDSQPV